METLDVLVLFLYCNCPPFPCSRHLLRSLLDVAVVVDVDVVYVFVVVAAASTVV